MSNRVPFKAVQAFEAAARLSSFALAAEELFVTPSAISHQIKQLEERLSVLLFHRIHRAVVLTDAGRRYAEEISAAFARIETATRDLSRQTKSDILKIHSSPSIAAQWLMPRLARFSAQNPDIDVHLKASTEPVNLFALTADIDVPKDGVGNDVPVTYVPARNLIFLSLTLGLAEARQAQDIVIGVNALDYSGYPDCRPEFIAGFEKLARLATRDGDKGGDFRIHAPLQHMTKADIAAEASRLGMDAVCRPPCADTQAELAAASGRTTARPSLLLFS